MDPRQQMQHHIWFKREYSEEIKEEMCEHRVVSTLTVGDMPTVVQTVR